MIGVMTSQVLRLIIGTLAGGLAAAPAITQERDPLAPLPNAPPVTVQRATRPMLPPMRVVPGPAALQAQVNQIVRGFNGKSGIAVVNLRRGWQVGWNETALFPQQSCSKLWVAITFLDAVDRGEVGLNEKVTLARDDLTLFHQPLAAKILGGGHTTTLSSLMYTAITQSDNTANDKLMRSVGGPDAVRAMIQRKGLGSIRFYNGERSLQSRIAGLTWSQSYSIGNAFYKARSALPMSVRRASFQRYIDDPYDGAAPGAVAQALARLKRGELLSAASTNRLLSTMGQTKTGKARVRAALARGWSWNHKTGTGQALGGRIGGINDIGLLTAPDGTTYAVAIFTVPNTSNGDAQGLMQSVTKAIIANHG